MKTEKTLIILLILTILVSGGIIAYRVYKDKNNKPVAEKNNDENVITVGVENKAVQIYQGNDRPIAVMIDNHKDAWPQAGLNKAYMVYEIVVEGGETRLMALFKGVNLDKIGPVRSARHYFLDYAMENDAIYVHFGWSPRAETDISKYGINNINGISENLSTFWRVKSKASPHNAVTSTNAILESAKSKGYKTTSTKSSILNYQTDEVNLSNGIDATTVTIPHSTLQTVKYEYDSNKKVYKRYARNKQQTDWDSGDAITTKNIIITKCDNYTLSDDEENKGRQGLDNLGTFEGYYITNGKAIKIKCVKDSRNSQTKYLNLNGNEIKVNDGNTWINICPTDAKIKIEGNSSEISNSSLNEVDNK